MRSPESRKSYGEVEFGLFTYLLLVNEKSKLTRPNRMRVHSREYEKTKLATNKKNTKKSHFYFLGLEQWTILENNK